MPTIQERQLEPIIDIHARTATECIYAALESHIPAGVNSPVRAFAGMGISPLVAAEGKEDLLFDADGNKWIDFCCGWGALLHGHAHPSICDALTKQVRKGTCYGVSTPYEAELAKEICSIVPGMEKIRFVSTGGEATQYAVRAARAWTGKPYILKFNGNYHGNADLFLVQAGSGVALNHPQATSEGIPAEAVANTLCLPYNDLEACENFFATSAQAQQLAAVIVEPVAGNMGVVPASLEFLQLLRKKTEEAGALLIYDEVITGFRVALQGAQALYPIKPDLICLGKVMGGGLPSAAFGGRAEVMNLIAPLGPVYQAGTMSGNPASMVAGKMAIQLAEVKGFYEELEAKARLVADPVTEALRDAKIPACLQRVGSMFTIFFGLNEVRSMEEAKKVDRDLFARYFRYLFERGVFVPPSPYEACFISSVHTKKHLLHARDVMLSFILDLEPVRKL